tara:strand:+ start:447 stop:2249 length:1803 start_codon:yes stop_codon:yes gene_type:complete
MIQEIFSSLFFFILVYLSSLGYGIIFKKFFFGNINNSLGETGIFGLFFLCFLSVFFHFFIPLTSIFNLIIIILGIIFLYFGNIFKEKYFKLEYLIILIIIVPSLLLFEYHADYFWYHLPYVNLVNDYKIIFGVANLNDNLGYSHIWYDLLAIYNLPFFGTKYLSILSILFLSFFLITLKDIFFKCNENIIKLFSFFCFCFVCLIYSNSKDFGSEIQGNLIYLIISLFILKYYLSEDKKNQNYIILSIVLLFFFAILIRTNSIIFFPLIFLFLIHNMRYLIKTILNYKLFYSFLIFFSILYLFKNFIITGCLSYPIYFTCFDLVEWGVGVEQAKFRFYHLSSQSKGYLLYLINENFIESIFNYYKFRTDNNFISPEKYLNNYNWLKNWWKYEYDIDRFLNIIYFFIFSIILIILFNKNKIKFSDIILSIKKYLFQIFLFSLPIFTWLLLLPQTRYGGYAIIFSITCLISIVLFCKVDKLKLYPFIIIFMISISYFGYKNIDRIIINFNGLTLQNHNNYYEYTLIGKKRFKINNSFEISVIERIINSEDILGKPLYCFDLKGLCSSSFRLDCINKIHKRNSYIVIAADKRKCASLIDEYLWY